jgi:4-hydroxyproline epimerase
MIDTIRVLDTHTGGEPTRVVVSGGPDLGRGPLAERRTWFREHFDPYRRAIVNEPRGSDVLVGALLVEPSEPDCAAGVVFFNNVGYLGMCGHGTIGVGVALGHLGRIRAGRHRLETPVGVVPFEYDGANTVVLENVPSYRHAHHVPVDLPGAGRVHGDVAWGGNWFYLVDVEKNRGLPIPDLDLRNIDPLTAFTWSVRQALIPQGVTGAGGAEIDHIELFGPARSPGAHSRNFVLCPGKAYDRSPCGTGTSAKLACLVADGKLKPGEVWRQESILGSIFEGSVRLESDRVIPRIAGSAWVTGEATLLLEEGDPFCWGIS